MADECYPWFILTSHSEATCSVPLMVERLRAFLSMPFNTREAVLFFWQRQERGIFLYLYRKYLPDDYRLSCESEEIDRGWNYSPREVEFFYLVADHLFPLDIDYMSEVGANGERATEMIPLLPYEMPWWENLEDLSPGWRILACLSGTLSTKDIERQIRVFAELPDDMLADVLGCAQAMGTAPAAVQEAIRQFFLGLDTPYVEYGQILALYHRRTGIGWLDTSEEELLYEDFCWCDEHFARLIAEYRAAQQYEERANAFALWLQQDISRIRQLVALLASSVSDFVQRSQRCRREDYGG